MPVAPWPNHQKVIKDVLSQSSKNKTDISCYSKKVSSTVAFGKWDTLDKKVASPLPLKKYCLEISICCCGIGICQGCRPIIDDVEKMPIRIPQTPSTANISMSIGNINLVVSVVNLMACMYCSLGGNLNGHISTVLLSSKNWIILSKNLFWRISHFFVSEMQFQRGYCSFLN